MSLKSIYDFARGWGFGFVICAIALSLLEIASSSSYENKAKTKAHIEVGLHDIENSKTSKDGWTDCLILSGTFAPNLNLLEYLGSPKAIIDKPCTGLDAAMINTNDAVWTSYDRYWLGSIYLATLVLDYFDASTAQHIYKFALVLAIFCLSFAGFKLRHNLRIPLAIVCLGILAGAGIDAFGGHFGHSPTYFLPLFIFAAFIIFPFKILTIRETAMFGAVIGAITCYFDILSGGIPFTLSLTIFIYYLLWLNSSTQSRGGKNLFIGVTVLCIAYILSVVALVVIKLFIATSVLGHSDVLQVFKGQLLWRMSTSETNANGRLTAIGMVTQRLWEYRSNVFIGGAQVGDIVFLVGGIAWFVALFVTWFNYRVTRNSGEVLYFIIPFVGAMVIPIWFLVFSSHGFIHAWFMTRIVCLVPAFGIASAWMGLGRVNLNRSSI